MTSSSKGSAPLIVTGMHRSGTSLTASWLTRLGIDMGRQLVPPDGANPRGYFEDTTFLALNRNMLKAACRQDAGGHPDWGWTEEEGTDPAALEELPLEEALAREGTRLLGASEILVREEAAISLSHQYFSYKARAQYSEQLEAWLRFFPPEQILVLQSEHLFTRPDSELRRVVRFLDLPSLPPTPLGLLNQGVYPFASEEVITMLERHFAPWNERLPALLGTQWNQRIDLSAWQCANPNLHTPAV